ncbi:hypothetical protein [Gracilimonas mengyeensis]|uniref:Glycosyl hydrolase family 65 central catalytic domain-containing protein n=1 Tax=Gracilimonas mengyeensis TaxID=1302730 RepID=A0A521BFL5_9BACT|nr:hypothetical protein [Gracilimonas mengyeensis]SMO45895.1 Glycosyl hydrolase family 65 central catalytic domain-containing protein [Gracilimonas mengyeensis]
MKSLVLAIFVVSSFFILSCNFNPDHQKPIDRRALVQRHIPTLSQSDSLSPFTVGNGAFAYTVDITGLQTFPDYYEEFIPLGTLAQWGWHSVPNTEGYRFEQTLKDYDTYGRPVSYAYHQNSEAGQWLRANPHRLHLGQIGFSIKNDNGKDVPLSELTHIDQEADIWEGIIKSNFSVLDESVSVQTAVHPQEDQLAATITSPLLGSGNLDIRLDFPYGSQSWGKKTAVWDQPEAHTSTLVSQDNHSALIRRDLDTTRYFVQLTWQGEAVIQQTESHSFILDIQSDSLFSFSARFSRDEPDTNPQPAEEVLAASKTHWKNFWETGGAIDLSESTDPRAHELERRIVLSRYLTAIQTSGSLPPAETGLTYNSWYGKFHLEMHWWHGVHYVLWDKPELFEKSLDYYTDILPAARTKAKRQGYEGVRWPKMTDYRGAESPSTIGVFLIWQQPNPIYYAELLYQYYDDESILNEYKDIVFETADFMASYAHFDSTKGRYMLGPPLIPAQERYEPEEAVNPAFEVAYWQFGLQTAMKWKERLGEAPDSTWAKVLNHLSPLPQNNGYYQNAENAMNTFQDERHRTDHPSVLGVFGMLPTQNVDQDMMRATLEQVMQSWDWSDTWGWDYPMTAMNAARLGEPETAINALLMDVQKNRYLNNGHNYQDENLTIYLPGNGGLLTAVAMMAAGWEGAPDIHAPGFPQDGSWVVKYENLHPLP